MAGSGRPLKSILKKTSHFGKGGTKPTFDTFGSTTILCPPATPEPKQFSARVQRYARIHDYDETISDIQIASSGSIDDETEEAIRYLIIWKKMYSVGISSLSLELLARHQSLQLLFSVKSADEIFRKCMGRLANCHDIRIGSNIRMGGAYIIDRAKPRVNTLDGTDLKSVSRAANEYFREFYDNNPTERGRSCSRSRGRSASRSRSRARSRSRSRARSRSRSRARSRSRGRSGSRARSAGRESPFDMSSLRAALGTVSSGQSSSSDDEMPDFGGNVADVVQCLQQMSHPDYSVKEIFKGGSLGKGTETVISDIDLVVFFNGLDSIQDLKRARPALLRMIKDELEQSDFEDEIEWEEGTAYAVKFVLRDIGVDVLPAIDIVEKLGSLDAVYRAMELFPGGKQAAAQEFSASLNKPQRDFVRRAESCVKEAIRELKEWKYDDKVPILSYCLELLAIYVHRKNIYCGHGSLFKRCVLQLTDCERLQIAFDEYYKSAKYTRSLKVPYILDPANPFRDTLEHVNAEKVSEKAQAYFRNRY